MPRTHSLRLILIVFFCSGCQSLSDALDRGLQSPAEQAYLQGLRSQKGENREDPLTCFDQAIRLDGSQSRYYVSRAGVLMSKNAFDRALSDYDKAINLTPEWSYLHYERGLCKCCQNNFESALCDFDTAIRQRPTNAQFYSGRALALLAMEKREEALRCMEKAIELAPSDCQLRYQKGLILSRLDRHAAAVDEFSKTEAYTLVMRSDIRRKVFFDGEREFSLCKTQAIPTIIRNWRRPIPVDYYYRKNNKLDS